MIWTRGCVDFQDELNDNVWRTSPQVQRSIQPPMMGRDGVVGAAQAFVGDQALPWVPDIVGRRWREPGSILLFGSSYADFFSPFAGRTNRMQAAYRATSTWQQFQESFLSAVVDDDRHYYDPIQRLLIDADVALERVVLTDLCRASFVAIHQGKASASESVLRDNDGLFKRYVRGNADWHYQRFEAFGGDVVVALGALASRGVRHLLGDAHSDQGWVRSGTPSKTSKVVWRGRELHILCVPHPAAHGQVPSDGAETLRALLNNAPAPPPAVRSVVRPSSATGQPVPAGLRSSDLAKYEDRWDVITDREVPFRSVNIPPEFSHLVKRVPLDALPEGHRRWTGNDASQRNHNGRIPSREKTVYMELRWKEDKNATEKLVGGFILNVAGLVRAGYVAQDPAGGVRLKFLHGTEGSVYVGRGFTKRVILIGRA